MTTAHIIENNIVVNTIVATPEEARVAYPDAICLDADQHPGGIGWTWDGEQLVPPPAPPQPVPQSVTMRQARLALLQAGLLAQVDGAIAALPEPDRTAAGIEWEYSQEVKRDQPFVQMLAPALGLDDEALDALFIHAATL